MTSRFVSLLFWLFASVPVSSAQSSWSAYPNNTTISVTAGGNVGVGATSPTQKLSVEGGNIYVDAFYYGGAGLFLRDPSTVSAQNLSIQSTNMFYSTFYDGLQINGYRGINLTTNNGTSQMVILNNGNVGIGTTDPTYKLTVDGNIGASDITVTNQGLSDYVFDPTYRLRPLGEVKAFIQANHHLPDIPSDAEARQKGISVSDMQRKLLAKIEELTLHMIRQEKDNQELRDQNRGLQDRITRLEGKTATVSAPAVR